jgi:NADH-quinone oxidoreductase subunit F
MDEAIARYPSDHRRSAAMPLLHLWQEHFGFISDEAVVWIAEKLGLPPINILELVTFYPMFRPEPTGKTHIRVCRTLSCAMTGGFELMENLCTTLDIQRPPADDEVHKPVRISADGDYSVEFVECLASCGTAPVCMISEHLNENADVNSIADLLRKQTSNIKHQTSPHPLEHRLIFKNIGRSDWTTDIDCYLRDGGYEQLKQALTLSRADIVNKVKNSGLRGRGGAGFSCGLKWSFIKPDEKRPVYLICNADESEPGTFKDRILMEGDPFAILEGMTIAGFAVGARKGFIYVRGEYPLAAERLEKAIHAAREKNFLGDNILRSGFSFDIEIRRGAGAYICGEETALFNSIEGYRGEPRNKPPFPTQSGLFREPTVVNNVETLVNVPEIILSGGAAYARIGTANSSGYRLFCVSGHVVHPGVYEIPFGPTIRKVIEMAGGVAGTGRLQAVLLGGAAGSFVSPKELDTALTFEGTRTIGATLGSGVVMLFDDSVDLKQILLRIAAFFRSETCGQCVPCRVGTIRQEEALQRLVQRKPLGSNEQESALLKEMAQAMRDASICGLGQTASGAILSAMERWSLFP